MRNFFSSDVARQSANLIGAVFQILAAAISGPAVGRVAQENESLILPSTYAFAIWTPIFALSLAYALYAAFPVKREDPLLRRVGWFTAAAFLLNGLWELLFPAERFILAQAVLVGVFLASGAGYLAVQRQISAARANEPLSGRWLVAPTVGLLFGWVSAATLVGFAATLSALGVPQGGIPGVMIAGALLIAGGVLASLAVLAGSLGPMPGYLAYGGAFLWAVIAIAVARYGVSEIIVAISALVALLVAGALAVSLREARSRGRTPTRRRAVS